MIHIPLNASSLKISACELRYHYTVVRGLIPKERREALEFGTAVHKYLEMTASGQPAPLALQRALQIYQGPETGKLAQVCAQPRPVMDAPHRDRNGRLGIELKFKIPWRTIEYDGETYQVDLAGTIDRLSFNAAGIVGITDYKTTRKWKAADVFSEYAVSVQMIFYAWVLYEYGHVLFDLDVANAARAGQMYVQICGIFLSGDLPRFLLGSKLVFTPDQLREFGEILEYHVLHNIIPAYKNPTPTGRLSEQCAKCDFQPVCYSASPETVIKEQFNTRVYDPANF